MGRRNKNKNKNKNKNFWKGDVLPLGDVYVDRCFNYVIGARCWDRQVKELNNAKLFVDTYGQRNGLLITPQIYDEFEDLIGILRKEKSRFEGLSDICKLTRGRGDEFCECEENIRIAIEAIEFYKKLGDRMLANYGEREEVPENGDAIKVRRFLDNAGADSGEKSLIFQMLSRKKNKATFYSSDRPALGICREGLLKFNRSGYLYDVRYNKISEIMRR